MEKTLRGVLTALCAFTILASLWLSAMFVILHHGGFPARAALSLGFVGISVATLVALHRVHLGLPLRLAVVAGAAALAVIGTAVVVQNSLPANADFEGYADVIGLALAAQGLLTIWWVVPRHAEGD